MPDACCTAVRVQNGRETHTSIQVSGGDPTSPRNGFTAYSAPPRRRIRLVTVVAISGIPGARGRHASANLTSNGCQNHTAYTYAAAPFVCAPFDRSGRLNPKPALQFTCAPGCCASPHPSNVVTMANALLGTGWGES